MELFPSCLNNYPHTCNTNELKVVAGWSNWVKLLPCIPYILLLDVMLEMSARVQRHVVCYIIVSCCFSIEHKKLENNLKLCEGSLVGTSSLWRLGFVEKVHFKPGAKK